MATRGVKRVARLADDFGELVCEPTDDKSFVDCAAAASASAAAAAANYPRVGQPSVAKRPRSASPEPSVPRQGTVVKPISAAAAAAAAATLAAAAATTHRPPVQQSRPPSATAVSAAFRSTNADRVLAQRIAPLTIGARTSGAAVTPPQPPPQPQPQPHPPRVRSTGSVPISTPAVDIAAKAASPPPSFANLFRAPVTAPYNYRAAAISAQRSRGQPIRGPLPWVTAAAAAAALAPVPAAISPTKKAPSPVILTRSALEYRKSAAIAAAAAAASAPASAAAAAVSEAALREAAKTATAPPRNRNLPVKTSAPQSRQSPEGRADNSGSGDGDGAPELEVVHVDESDDIVIPRARRDASLARTNGGGGSAGGGGGGGGGDGDDDRGQGTGRELRVGRHGVGGGGGVGGGSRTSIVLPVPRVRRFPDETAAERAARRKKRREKRTEQDTRRELRAKRRKLEADREHAAPSLAFRKYGMARCNWCVDPNRLPPTCETIVNATAAAHRAASLAVEADVATKATKAAIGAAFSGADPLAKDRPSTCDDAFDDFAPGAPVIPHRPPPRSSSSPRSPPPLPLSSSPPPPPPPPPRFRWVPYEPDVRRMSPKVQAFYRQQVWITDQRRAEIETYTQGSPQWKAARRHRMGGSNLAGAVGDHPYQSEMELAAEMIDSKFSGNKATERGQLMEPAARRELLVAERAVFNHSLGEAMRLRQPTVEYRGRHYTIPANVRQLKPRERYDIVERGAKVSRRWPHVSSSSDGDIYIFGTKVGIIEVKTPEKNKAYINSPSYYYAQVQGNMHVHEVTFCLFVCYVEPEYRVWPGGVTISAAVAARKARRAAKLGKSGGGGGGRDAGGGDAKDDDCGDSGPEKFPPLQVDQYEYDRAYCEHYLFPRVHRFYYGTYLPFFFRWDRALKTEGARAAEKLLAPHRRVERTEEKKAAPPVGRLRWPKRSSYDGGGGGFDGFGAGFDSNGSFGQRSSPAGQRSSSAFGGQRSSPALGGQRIGPAGGRGRGQAVGGGAAAGQRGRGRGRGRGTTVTAAGDGGNSFFGAYGGSGGGGLLDDYC